MIITTVTNLRIYLTLLWFVGVALLGSYLYYTHNKR